MLTLFTNDKIDKSSQLIIVAHIRLIIFFLSKRENILNKKRVTETEGALDLTQLQHDQTDKVNQP
jgi:hypothetical protein